MGSNDSKIKGWIGRNWIAIVLSLAIVTGVVATYCVLQPSDFGYVDLIEVAGVTGSLLLTVAIVSIYSQLQRIENDQLTIQEQQQALLQQNESPTLVLDRWDIGGNTLEFQVTNVGKGPAINVKYVLQITPIRGAQPPQELKLDQAPKFQLIRSSNEDDVGKHRTTVQPNSTGTFEGQVQLRLDNDSASIQIDADNEYFQPGTAKLLEEYSDAERFNLRIGIYYESDIGAVDAKYLPILNIDHEYDAYQQDTLQDVVETLPSGWQDPENNILPDCVSIFHSSYFDIDEDEGYRA